MFEKEFSMFGDTSPRQTARVVIKEIYGRAGSLSIGALGVLAMLSGCVASGDYGPDYAYRQYDYNRPDPQYNGYDAGRYYNDHPRYRERRMNRNDRVYRGNDGRYYCRRNDGTTGLIVGAIAGGVIGNIIAPGDSEILGTVLGAGGGAAIGRSIDRNGTRCR
jgi:Glycine zipper 2TM domain